MTRAFACLMVAAFAVCATAASAEDLDTRDLMNFGPNMKTANPIPRQTGNFQSQYAPGTIVVNTAERRLYLVLPN